MRRPLSDATLARLLARRPRLTYRAIAERYDMPQTMLQHRITRLIGLGLAERRYQGRPLAPSPAKAARLTWMRRELRRGTTQSAIARELGVTPQYVSQLVQLWDLRG